MQKKTMADVRETLGRTMEVVCGKREIKPEHRNKLMRLNEGLNKQLLHDLDLPEKPGVLSDVSDRTQLSAKAGHLLEMLNNELSATLHAAS